MDLPEQAFTFTMLFSFFAPKVVASIVAGGTIGLERELKNKAAGIKTNILICFGAALYTGASVLISGVNGDSGFFGDPGRLAAQIVSGIGFLGGGAIIQSRGTVVGLTTAATIWVVAALGVVIGMGYHFLAIALAAVVVFVLTSIRFLEHRILNVSSRFVCEIVMLDPDNKLKAAILGTMEEQELDLEDCEVRRKSSKTIVTVRYSGQRDSHKRFVLGLWGIPGVEEVKQR